MGKFREWQKMIETTLNEQSHADAKMAVVLSGIMLGITVQNALNLCMMTEMELQGWFSKSENMRKYRRAVGYAEAQLEYVVHQMAQSNPYFASELLTKRNPNRWDTDIPKQVKESTLTSVSISKMLKPVNLDEDFDVTN